jgi:hypothetical protein
MMAKASSRATTVDDLDCLRKWQQKLNAMDFDAPQPDGFVVDDYVSQSLYAPEGAAYWDLAKSEVEAMLRLGLDFPQPIQQINDLPKIVDACWADARAEALDGRYPYEFYYAIRNLAERIEAVISIIDDRIGQRPPAGTWCHSPDEPRPDHFPYGPITGTASFLNECIGGKPDRNARQLHTKGRRGLLWIVERDRTTYEVWLRTQGEIDAAKRRQEAAKTPTTKRKARRESRESRESRPSHVRVTSESHYLRFSGFLSPFLHRLPFSIPYS